MMTLGWPWPILQQGQIWFYNLLYGEKLLLSHIMEEPYSKWPEWQKVYVKIKNSDPKGVVFPCPGLYSCINKQAKICIKSDFKDIFFETCNKLAKWQGLSVNNRFLSTKGCLPRGYIHVEKHQKMCIKSEVKEMFLKLATNDRSG